MLLCTIKVCLRVGECQRTETETDRDSAYIKRAGKNIFYCNTSLRASLCLLMNRRRQHVVHANRPVAESYSISNKTHLQRSRNASLCVL